MNKKMKALEEIAQKILNHETIGILNQARKALALPEENPWIRPPQMPEHINWVEITMREYIDDEWKKKVIPAFYENGVWWEWLDERLYFQEEVVIEFVCWREMPTPGP